MNAAEQHRDDVVEKREDWKKLQEHVDVKKLVFLDETWAKTNMTPTHGRAEIGKRVIDFVPHGHWKTTMFLSALRHDGLVAPLVVDGPINGKKSDSFATSFRPPNAATTSNTRDITKLTKLLHSNT